MDAIQIIAGEDVFRDILMMDVNPLTLGIETVGGVMVSHIPIQRSYAVLVSMAADTMNLDQTDPAQHGNSNRMCFVPSPRLLRGCPTNAAATIPAKIANLLNSRRYVALYHQQTVC